jgi:hypothetical protein
MPFFHFTATLVLVQKSALFTTGGMITVFILSPPTELLHLPVLMEIAPYGFYLGLLGLLYKNGILGWGDAFMGLPSPFLI